MVNNKNRPKPLVLIMLEGLGIAPNQDANAFLLDMPYLSHLVGHYPAALLSASGTELGLSADQPSNSLLASAIIGSGRAWPNPQFSLEQKVIDQSLFTSEKIQTFRELIKEKKTIHLISLFSPSEKEASVDQLKDLIDWLKNEGADKVKIHAILDGQEASPTAGQKIIEDFSEFLKNYPGYEIVSLIGRLYALDNRVNYQRTLKAINLFTLGQGNVVEDLVEAMTEAYSKKIFDQEFPATIINRQANSQIISDNDLVVFVNHHKTSIRQLVEQFLLAKPAVKFVSLADYGLADKVLALDSVNLSSDSLGKVISDNGLRQLRLADSASFAQITNYLDYAAPTFYEGLDKKLIATNYEQDLVDSLLDNIKQLRQSTVEAIQNLTHDVIFITFSQIDLIAHQTNKNNFKQIVAAVDEAIKLIIEALESTEGVALLVGTHGLAEQISLVNDDLDKPQHTTNPVPFYVVGNSFKGFNLGWPEALGNDLSLLKPIGNLTDIAPTILTLLQLPIPEAMTGHNLLA